MITAELINDENKYDCDIYDQYAFEPSNRIFSSYEIVVEPKEGTFYKVDDSETYTVGKTLYNGDKTVGVTLGGWTYNNNSSYYDKYQDSYSKKNSGKDKNSRRMLTERVTLQIAVRRKKTYSMNSLVMPKRRSPQMAVVRRRASN